ncbi:hypothetical protein RSOLAG1IB_06515 [Rhizoctonia solani AG-1 IB]|nr:hypothetical protein RSOLAG1IB_06515 [Rhizoctonia solani AG-1 IB]
MAKNKKATLTSRGGSVVFTGKESGAKTEDTLAEIPSAKPAGSIIRNPEFFFDNTLIAIQIENMLFNVHKYQLIKSEVFSDMFKIPKPDSNEPEEGSSPEHPIIIEGVAPSDFTALLRVLYASHFSSNQPAPEAPLIIPAFRLANMFNFIELRAFLLPLAEKNLDDVDKIIFAREFSIKEWLAPAHVRLCERDTPLTSKEASKLEFESVLIIWRMREQYRGPSSTMKVNSNYCNSCAGMSYTGSSYNCNGCGGYSANLRYNGFGKSATGGTVKTNSTAIEAGVKKWVEDGCTVKE